MSHIVNVATQFKNMEALKRAADKRGVRIEIAAQGQTISRTLYTGKVEGVAAVDLKGWKYPAMVQADGSCKADNYGGAWGQQAEMDGLAQEYGSELAMMTLKRQGYRLQTDKVEADGTRELVFVS